MATILSVYQLSKSFAAKPLYTKLSFSVESGERIGLIGPNGAGKSTLLRIVSGQISPDSGSVSMNRGLRIGFLEQIPQFLPKATIHSTIMEGAIDIHDWQTISLAQEILSKLNLTEKEGFPEDTPIDRLSGGWKKRVALARELLRQPDLLLLDEPTNHLDVESIMWLEDFLNEASFATITITHDRAFLQNICNRIIEVDRRNPGGLLSKVGSYADFLDSKELLIAGQEAQEERLRNTLRRETEWLRRGAKARTTKQQARINRHEEISSNVDDLAYRNKVSTVQIDFVSADRKPKKLLEATNISKSYNGKVIVPNLNLLISPKSRIGLLGPNGCGKSTLIRMLIGKEKPDTGSVYIADQIQVAYFEQNRESLDPNVSLLKTICPMGDFVDFGGTHVHARSYLGRFLFSHDQMDMPVGKLSGGEQSRLVIAQLMLLPANVLILDEPTNDLDTSTLDILEDVLKDFEGAVILVTHDRYFLDQVAQTILAFDTHSANAVQIIPFSGVTQWEAWYQTSLQEPVVEKSKSSPTTEMKASTDLQNSDPQKRKASQKEQKEFSNIEKKIKELESKLKTLESESLHPETHSNSQKLTSITKEMASLHGEIEKLFERWSELETLCKGLETIH
jgi:ATP-binding cassette subfamily F protein uup